MAAGPTSNGANLIPTECNTMTCDPDEECPTCGENSKAGLAKGRIDGKSKWSVYIGPRDYPCPDCQETGLRFDRNVPEEFRCPKCNGKGVQPGTIFAEIGDPCTDCQWTGDKRITALTFYQKAQRELLKGRKSAVKGVGDMGEIAGDLQNAATNFAAGVYDEAVLVVELTKIRSTEDAKKWFQKRFQVLVNSDQIQAYAKKMNKEIAYKCRKGQLMIPLEQLTELFEQIKDIGCDASMDKLLHISAVVGSSAIPGGVLVVAGAQVKFAMDAAKKFESLDIEKFAKQNAENAVKRSLALTLQLVEQGQNKFTELRSQGMDKLQSYVDKLPFDPRQLQDFDIKDMGRKLKGFAKSKGEKFVQDALAKVGQRIKKKTGVDIGGLGNLEKLLENLLNPKAIIDKIKKKIKTTIEKKIKTVIAKLIKKYGIKALKKKIKAKAIKYTALASLKAIPLAGPIMNIAVLIPNMIADLDTMVMDFMDSYKDMILNMPGVKMVQGGDEEMKSPF